MSFTKKRIQTLVKWVSDGSDQALKNFSRCLKSGWLNEIKAKRMTLRLKDHPHTIFSFLYIKDPKENTNTEEHTIYTFLARYPKALRFIKLVAESIDEKHQNPLYTTSSGRNAIQIATALGHYDQVEYFILEYPYSKISDMFEKINKPFPTGETHNPQTGSNQHSRVIRLLLKNPDLFIKVYNKMIATGYQKYIDCDILRWEAISKHRNAEIAKYLDRFRNVHSLYYNPLGILLQKNFKEDAIPEDLRNASLHSTHPEPILDFILEHTPHYAFEYSDIEDSPIMRVLERHHSEKDTPESIEFSIKFLEWMFASEEGKKTMLENKTTFIFAAAGGIKAPFLTRLLELYGIEHIPEEMDAIEHNFGRRYPLLDGVGTQVSRESISVILKHSRKIFESPIQIHFSDVFGCVPTFGNLCDDDTLEYLLFEEPYGLTFDFSPDIPTRAEMLSRYARTYFPARIYVTIYLLKTEAFAVSASESIDSVRFFKIALQLPNEICMLLSAIAYSSSGRYCINSRLIATEFRRIFKRFDCLACY